jgi:Glycosyl transferases group 1
LVHFAGAVYEERALATAFMASDLAVIPAGAGLSIMHAFAYGTPVLLHDRVEEHFPEWEAVTEGVTGFYYRYGDMGHLAVKIEEALFPQPKKANMTMACREVIESRYNPRRQAEAMMEAVGSVRAKATHRDRNPKIARSCPKVGS